jgi:glycosyltransferase involved in cell wall biosynthesis
MKVTVLVPARNEQATIVELLRRVDLALAPYDHQIIVMDDGSTDATPTLAQGLPAVEVMSLRPGRGKGAAIQAALPRATGDVILIQDADLEYNPADYPALLAPLAQGAADVVYGSRVLGGRDHRSIGASSLRYYFGGLFLSWLTSFLYNARITDVSTGYKVFRASVLRTIPLTGPGFEFCPEVTARLLRRKIRILEVPISYTPRTFAEGKKIRWRDGAIAIWTLLRCRWAA